MSVELGKYREIRAEEFTGGNRDHCEEGGATMHYPRRTSRIKKKRKQGFRARMRTASGRKMLSRKRARGAHCLTSC